MGALSDLLIRLGIDRTQFTTGLAESEKDLQGLGGSMETVGASAANMSAGQLKAQESAALAELAQNKYNTALLRYGDTAPQTVLAEAHLGQARMTAAAAAKAEAVETEGLTGMVQGFITPQNIAVAAITASVAIMGESIKAAQEDSQSISLLNTSLKANVPAWGGNVAAIEDYISTEEEASAFTKDELRTSLETLVGATHDVTKAEQDQVTATNLARYTGESLKDATQSIVDVEAGRFRGLAALGIAVGKNETAQQALNQINAIAAGQDTSYLGTAAGAEAELTNKIHDLEVELGQKLMPVFKDVLNFINANLIPAVSFLASVWDKALDIITFGASKGLEEWNAYQQAQDDAAAAAAVNAQVAAAATQNWVDQTVADLGDAGQAGQAYWNKAKADQLAAQQAEAAATAVHYADALQQQRASADERLSAQDMASGTANNHAITALNAETAAEAKILDAANKQQYALENKAGFGAAAALAQGFAQGRDNVKTGWQNLILLMKTVPSTPAQIAKDEGELGSKTLAEALSSHKPEVKAAAIAQVQTLMDELTLLGVKAPQLSKPAAAALQKAMAAAKSPTLKAAEDVQSAVQTGLTADYYAYGYATGMTWVSGMAAALSGAPAKVSSELAKTKGRLKAESPPTDPANPLHDIGKWGFATGDAWTQELAHGLGSGKGIQSALEGVGSRFGGIGGSGLTAGLAGVGHAGAVPPTVHTHVYMNRREIVEQVDQGLPMNQMVYGQAVPHASSQR